MKTLFKTMVLLSFAVSSLTFSNGVSANSEEHFEKAKIDMKNYVSLQNGAKIFVNYCLGCHSLKYQRYERLANDLHIPPEIVTKNLMFTANKIGETMSINMPAVDAAKFFGTTPPDLSLITRAKGVDYIYAYLRGFYQDDTRPFGVNNTAFDMVAMPHVLESLQGLQRKTDETVFQENIIHEAHSKINAIFARLDKDGADVAKLNKEKTEAEEAFHKATEAIADLKHEGKYFQLVHKGEMTPEAFDKAMLDLVNFLSYVSEPIKAQRIAMGVWVILFLIVLFIVTYLLKKEYWKDVH